MGVDNGGSAYQQELEHQLELARADRDQLAMALERIARGAESNPPHEISEIAWAALGRDTQLEHDFRMGMTPDE